MNKRTRILLAILASLLAVTALLWVVRLSDRQDSLRIPALGRRAGLVDVITVGMGGRTVEMRRAVETWKYSPPDGAVADRSKVAAVLSLFDRDLQSVIPSDVGADPSAFGLDPDHAIVVTLSEGNAKVLSLEIGAVQTTGDTGPDTFVREPGSKTAFRITDVDLRAPFDGGPDSLRSRLLFGFAPDAITGVEFFNPAAADPVERRAKVRFEGPKDSALARTMWQIVEPSGWAPGKIAGLTAQLAVVTVDGWSDVLPAGVTIPRDAPGATIELQGGATVTARLSPPVDGYRWVAVDGMDGFARLGQNSAALFMKSIFDLADTSMVTMAPDEISSVSVSGPGKTLSVARRKNGFVQKSPAGGFPDKAVVEAWLREIRDLKASGIRSGGNQIPAADWLQVTLSDLKGAVTTMSFGPVDKDGMRDAVVSGRYGLFRVADSAASILWKSADDLRVRSVCSIPLTVLDSITVTSPVFGTAAMRPPEKGEKYWSVRFADGSTASSAELTTLAGAAMSMQASAFLRSRTPSAVRASNLGMEFRGGGRVVSVRISSETAGDGYVAALKGNAAMAGQSFVVPKGLVDSVAAVFTLR